MVSGLMKDEYISKIVTEFFGLHSKMYSIRGNSQDITKKSEGVKAGVVRKEIDFNDYINCLQNSNVQSKTQYSIRSRLHNFETIKQCQKVL